MVNYVYCVTSLDNIDIVSSYFQNYADKNVCNFEIISNKNLGTKHTVFLAARESSSSIKSNGSVFKGYAISHARREIIFSPSLEHDYTEYLEGCFFNAKLEENNIGESKILIRGDVFGQLPIIYTSLPGIFICSDSLLALTDFRKTIGFTNTINENLFLAKSAHFAFCDQLLNEGTIVDDIKYALPGSVINLNFLGSDITNTITHEGAERIFNNNGESYVESVQSAALSMVGLLSGCLEINGTYLRHDLSGGQDSRLALAASLGYRSNRDKIVLQSAMGMADDLRIANQIAGHVNIPLNVNPVSPITEYIKVPYAALWFASSAGVYDPLYALNRRQANINFFLVGGHGAEVYKGNYGWYSVNSIAKWTGKSTATAVSQEAQKGLEQFGIDPDCPSGSEWHYIAFRNALHSGRFTNATVYGLRPILNRTLAGLAHKVFATHGRPESKTHSIISDLLIHINPHLALLPFDDPIKNLSADYIASRIKDLGLLTETAPYTVIGAPNAASSGPLDRLLDLAKSKNFGDSFTRESIIKNTQKSYDLAPSGLKQIVEEMSKFVDVELEEPVIGNTKASRAAGKLMSIHLID